MVLGPLAIFSAPSGQVWAKLWCCDSSPRTDAVSGTVLSPALVIQATGGLGLEAVARKLQDAVGLSSARCIFLTV